MCHSWSRILRVEIVEKQRLRRVQIVESHVVNRRSNGVREVRRREVAARVAAIDGEMNRMRQERDGLAGALDDIDYNQTIWTGGDEFAAPPKTQET